MKITNKYITITILVTLILIVTLFARWSNNVHAQENLLRIEEVVKGSATSSPGYVSTTTEISGGTNMLYVASISSKPNRLATSVDGLGLYWSRVKSQCSGRSATNMEVWFAVGSPNAGGVVTVNYDDLPSSAVLSVTRISGANITIPIGNVLGNNTVADNDSNCSGGTDKSLYSTEFSTSTSGSLILSSVGQRNRSHTPGSDYTESVDFRTGTGGDDSGMAIQNAILTNPTNHVVNGQFSSSVDYAQVILEIIPSGTEPTIPTPTPGTGIPGDANGDSLVDEVDYSIWLSNYNTNANGGAGVGDFNYDGWVDGIDYVIWYGNYGVSPTSTPTIIPTQTPTVVPTNTPTPTATAIPTPTPTSGPTVPPGVSEGIWISESELSIIPTSGSAWDKLNSAANSNWGSACLYDNNCPHDVNTLAGALVAARTNDTQMRSKVIQGLDSAMNSSLSRALELSRGLQSYIIAADIIGYRTPEFEQWIRDVVYADIQGHSGTGLYGTAVKAPNNWGGHARASLAAAGLYLNDQNMVDAVVKAQKEMIGLPVNSPEFVYKDTDWHADSGDKAGVNRIGSQIQNVNVSGVLPEDWRRGGGFRWLPASSGYMWEGMQGYVVTSVLLHRAGLLDLGSADNSVVRAMDMLYGYAEASQNSPVYHNYASGDDTWIPWLINYYTGRNYPLESASPGKGMGWTDWTHQ